MDAVAAVLDIRASVEGALLPFLSARARDLPDAAPLFAEIERLTLAGGKRLRPAFCIWGYRAGGGTDEVAIARAAASLELLHTFAIIHDDVMDRSPVRRGEDATYVRMAEHGDGRLGVSSAILVGDLAMALADELWWSSGFEPGALERAARVYHAMRAEVIAGQFLDLRAGARGDATPDEIRRIGVLKSGRYTVERPLEIGAALAGATPAVREALARYGAPLGEAFQHRDDVLGAFGDPATTGKDVDSDLREGKQTLLLAFARSSATPEQRAALERVGAQGFDREEAERARAAIRDSGALGMVLTAIEALHRDAVAALGEPALPRDASAALRALASDVITREA